MTVRIALICAVATMALAGCSMDRPLLNADGPIFGHGPLLPMFERADVAPAVAIPVEFENAQPAVHTQAHESWGEPQLIPVGIDGPQAVADTDGPYLLDSGDRLRVFIYGQPNLSRLYTVDHAGRISVPLIGEINARGMTTYGLKAVITEYLEEKYVRDPHVTVDINQHRPFFILGEVRNSGQFPYVPGMTIETAIAIAGGYSPRASDRSFKITRRINGFVEKIEAPGDYVVKAGDTVFVYERFF